MNMFYDHKKEENKYNLLKSYTIIGVEFSVLAISVILTLEPLNPAVETGRLTAIFIIGVITSIILIHWANSLKVRHPIRFYALHWFLIGLSVSIGVASFYYTIGFC
jgi:hypothetical protein